MFCVASGEYLHFSGGVGKASKFDIVKEDGILLGRLVLVLHLCIVLRRLTIYES